MLTELQTNIIAYVDSLPGNTATIPAIAAAIGSTPAVVTAELAAVSALLTVAGETVTLTKVEGVFQPETDASIDPMVTQAVADLFADQGVSLTTFLTGVSNAGFGSSDTRRSIYIARQMALGIAARYSDDRLREPFIRTAGLLAILQAALIADGR